VVAPREIKKVEVVKRSEEEAKNFEQGRIMVSAASW
jgi:hypothetical protein